MKLPWQKSDESSPVEPTSTPTPSPAEPKSPAPAHPKGYTPPKGRPTPKRREVEIERGIIRDPRAPRSAAQASAQRKELKKSMSKEEWKAYKSRERDENRRRQQEVQRAMDDGDERYLLPRDQGPERRLVRDWVDSRRFVNNWVLPVALGLLVTLFIGTFAPDVANIMSLIAMALMVVFFIEGVWAGMAANRTVREKFPDSTATGLGLGFYTYSRMTQPRKWRSPKPRVNIGDKV
ncbi:MAG: DUF3043 domain-containing protein [Corynebacterium humireducens]|uniref:DUF3043 domain-containing protein n=2 Tax=Corynebacterium humireducens TaxID=1223514 RepID=A0A0B5D3U4_9CORY|nr:DUF3043 domain-containing protein [Corynebacterium humireducens]AJE33630.1 hypothetical protein B842_08905 [Corynebacterium humireducens NBRC 106098 = DSM 45392]NLA55524.1 DUF3043 domain-containing protein [Corynebacterium humireducens]